VDARGALIDRPLNLRIAAGGIGVNLGEPPHPTATQKWTPSFGQENAEIKLGSQALRD
jgi:hypothetical protein